MAAKYVEVGSVVTVCASCGGEICASEDEPVVCLAVGLLVQERVGLHVQTPLAAGPKPGVVMRYACKVNRRQLAWRVPICEPGRMLMCGQEWADGVHSPMTADPGVNEFARANSPDHWRQCEKAAEIPDIEKSTVAGG